MARDRRVCVCVRVCLYGKNMNNGNIKVDAGIHVNIALTIEPLPDRKEFRKDKKVEDDGKNTNTYTHTYTTKRTESVREGGVGGGSSLRQRYHALVNSISRQ